MFRVVGVQGEGGLEVVGSRGSRNGRESRGEGIWGSHGQRM